MCWTFLAKGNNNIDWKRSFFNSAGREKGQKAGKYCPSVTLYCCCLLLRLKPKPLPWHALPTLQLQHTLINSIEVIYSTLRSGLFFSPPCSFDWMGKVECMNWIIFRWEVGMSFNMSFIPPHSHQRWLSSSSAVGFIAESPLTLATSTPSIPQCDCDGVHRGAWWPTLQPVLIPDIPH